MKSKRDFTDDKEWLEYLRYYYAGLGLQRCFIISGMTGEDREKYKHETSFQILAEYSVKYADALIAELTKP